MRNISIASGILMAAATVVVCLVIPASRVISVGDDVSAVRAVKIYGYPKSYFCLSSKAAGFKTPMQRVAFCVGDGWHLLVWHNDRVQRLVHFQYVSRGMHRYGDWIHTREVESFEVPRPSLVFYFVGLGVLFGLGWITHSFKWIHRIVFGLLLFLVVLGNLVMGGLSESVAMFPLLVSIGWVSAFLLGANLFRSAHAEKSCLQQEEVAEQSAPPTAQT